MNIDENYNKTKKNFTVLGVDFNACSVDDMVKLIHGLDVSVCSAHVTFIGVPIVNLCQKEEAYKDLYSQTSITSVDGQPIANLANKCGLKCERCSGPDVMYKILSQSVERGEKHFFYGSSREVLDKLITNLKNQFEGINIVGSYSPPFKDLTEEEDREIIKIINENDADYVWVGLGAPKQDVWINSHLHKINNVKFMAVGAAFDFYAGTLKRAPVWMRKIGLEWLYRLMKEPRRLWNRYVVGGFEWKKNKKKFYKELAEREL